MSQIVENTKPVAEALILDKAVTISREERENLAAWIALALIMAEFTHPASAGIPSEDRESLRTNCLPPDSWKIFIGRYIGAKELAERYWHTGGKLQLLNEDASITAVPLQASTYNLGALVVHAFSSPDPSLREHFDMNFIPSNMTRIWPSLSSPEDAADLIWPDGPGMEEEVLVKNVDDIRQSLLPGARASA